MRLDALVLALSLGGSVMRTMTGPEAALLAGVTYKVTPRIKVENGSGTMIDYTVWLERWSLDHDVDMPVSGAVFEFRRDHLTTQSLAPLRADSTLNRDDIGNYSPALDPERAVTFEVATTAIGAAIVGSDYKMLFKGAVDLVNWERSPVNISCRDQGGALVDAWLELEDTYGSAAGVALETVDQQILNAASGSIGIVTLYTPVSPVFLISPAYKQQRQSVMDALLALQQLRGWDTRYWWDAGTSTFRLTLQEPPRSKTVPDYTFGPSQYLDVTALFLDRTNIRNVVTVSYLDSSTLSREPGVPQSDATSIARFGRRYFLMQEGDDSPINTSGEATTMGALALSDLKDPKAEQEIELPFFWPAEIWDLYRFSANGIHYNSNQDLAVVSFRHEGSTESARTFLKIRGKPAGAYINWLGRLGGDGSQPETALALNDFKVIAESETELTYGWTAGGSVAEVWAGQFLFPLPVPTNPWDRVLLAMGPLPSGTDTLTVTKPDENHVLFLQIEPRESDLTPGKVQRLVVNGAPTQPPVITLDDIETSTTASQWVKLVERGLFVTGVQFRTQVGITPISSFAAPTREPGDASVVKGGVLGTLEYEHDVTLDPTRFSFIDGVVSLDNGQQLALGPFGFDRDKNPNLISATVSGTTITAIADVDTRSISIIDQNSSWKYEVDEKSVSADVTKIGTNGVAGLGAGSNSTYTVKAQSEPLDNAGSALIDSRDVQVTQTAPGSLLSTVSALAPSAIGSTSARITINCTVNQPTWSTKVYIGASDTLSNPPVSDHTADLTPTILTPRTASQTYTYETYEKTVTTGHPRLVTMKVRVDLIDAGAVVVDTKTTYANWYTGGGAV